MYSRFVFGNFNDFNDYDLNKRQRHPYGAFLDVFDGTGDQNLFWHCKKRMFQNKIRATSENTATDTNTSVIVLQRCDLNGELANLRPYTALTMMAVFP